MSGTMQQPVPVLYKLDEYDKAKKETGKPPSAKPVASKAEADIYAALGMSYIEPELREDRGEIELAQKVDVSPPDTQSSKLLEQRLALLDMLDSNVRFTADERWVLILP